MMGNLWVGVYRDKETDSKFVACTSIALGPGSLWWAGKRGGYHRPGDHCLCRSDRHRPKPDGYGKACRQRNSAAHADADCAAHGLAHCHG